MSFFKLLYQNTVIPSHKNLIDSFVYSDYYPDISYEAQSNLLYLQNHALVKTKYPYAIHANSLDSYLILYTIDGQSKITYSHHDYILEKNCLFFINCQKGFDISLENSSSWEYHRFYINGYSLSYFFYKYIKNDTPLHICYPNSNLPTCLDKLIGYIEPNEYDEIVCSLLIHTILTNLVTERKSCNTKTIIPKYILELRDLLDNQYFNNFDLDTLSRMFNINKYTLSKSFTKYINISPIEYLIRRRILVAKELLVNTNYTISEISFRVGIYNTTYFISLFKKHVGITPLQYRKRHNRELAVLKTF